MKFIYGVTEEVYVLGDTTRIAYGIAAYAGSETDQTFTTAASVRDISPDKCQIQKLADLCSRLELDISHLDDVVEDFLAQI